VRLIVSDAADFSSPSILLADFTPNPDRHIGWDVGATSTPQRYSGTGYGALRMEAAAGFRPEIGALWLGRRRQLRRGPDVPYDERERASRVIVADGASGIDIASTDFAGRRVLRGTITPDDSLATLRDTDTLRSWWTESRQGSAPFLFARAPSSAPSDVGLFKARPSMSIPLLGPVLRSVQIDGLELPPFLAAEGL
jgi:hypothetical protein